MTDVPSFKVKGGKLKKLFDRLDQLAQCVRERTPRPGKGTKLTAGPNGFNYDANAGTGNGNNGPARWG